MPDDRFPFVTYALAVACVAVAYFVTGIFPTAASIAPVAWSRESLAAGDWNAMLWSTFAHGGPVHLLVNMMALVSFGPFVERALGHGRFLLLYAGAGVAGNLAHALFGPDVPAVGASGAIFGLLGILLVLAPLAQVALMGVLPMPILLASALYVATVPLLLGLSDVLPIAHEAHLGGMVFGIAAVVLFRPGRAARVIPAAVTVFASSWFGVAHVVGLDFGALARAGALEALEMLWPLLVSVAVVGAAFSYLARVEARPASAA